MDGQDRLNTIVSLNPTVFFLKKERNHGGMIIMNMDDIWNKVYSFHHFQRCQLEIGKALPIIKISVDMSSKEIFLVINKIESNTITIDAFHTNVFTSPSNSGLEV